MLKYITLLRSILSPPTPPIPAPQKQPRSPKEKAKSKAAAAEILATLVPDLAASVVGRANAAAAGRRLWATVNNTRLNASIVFTLVDEVVGTVFAEVVEGKQDGRSSW